MSETNAREIRSRCGRWGFINKKDGRRLPFYCKLARCQNPVCQEIRHRERIRLFDALVREKDMTRFFTLTFDPGDWPSVESQWEFASWCWSKFRHRLKRAFPSCKFIAVLEAHKDGRPHIHGLFSAYVPFEWMQKHWSECNGGHSVRIEKVKTGEISDYLSKGQSMAQYLSKGATDISKHVARRQRTMWRSVGLKASFESKPEVESDWELVRSDCYDGHGNLLDTELSGMIHFSPTVAEQLEEMEVLYGKEDRKGQDLEGALPPLPEEGTGGR